MRAAVLHSISDMRVEKVDTPRAGSADILLKVAFCGVCGSDTPRIIKGTAHYYPIILGHEFSGMIVDVGDDLSPDLKGKKSVCAPLMPNFSDPEWEYGVEMITRQQVDIKALMGSPLPLSQARRIPALLSETGGVKRKIVLDCST